MESVDCLVIGAGIVGLSVARALARAGHEVIILESQDRIGPGISSRNSEVIHAGLYYPANLKKARWCVDGKAMLYEFCKNYHVPFRRCGKLVVAANEAEVEWLAVLNSQGEANGGMELVWLSGVEARALEPALSVHRALLSPSTGIIDTHALVLALRGDAERHGAMVALGAPALYGRRDGGGLAVETGGASSTEIAANLVVNAAGLGSHGFAPSIYGMPSEKIPPLHLAKGNYFALAKPAPFSHLNYPVPAPGGLGIHLTFDLAGQARFGSDVEWVNEVDYAVDSRRVDAFYPAIRKYWPKLPDGSLQPSFSGIRPKIARPGGSETDFQVQTERDHGVPGLINLFGIESPGLTSSLAIAESIAKLASIHGETSGLSLSL